MKTLIIQRVTRFLSLAFVLGLFSSAPALAQDTAPCKWTGVEQLSAFKYRVWACNPAAKRGSVKLLDSKDKVLYQQYSTATNFGSNFDVANLPDGEYKIRVRMGDQLYFYSLNLESTSQRFAKVKDLPTSPSTPRVAAVATSLPTSAAGH